MAPSLPRGTPAIVLALGHGARCYTARYASTITAYLERHGRRTAIDLPALQSLLRAGYVAPRPVRGHEQIFVLTAKGRRAYRGLIQPGWYRWLPWTPLQRLQLLMLPLCLVLGMLTDVVLGELHLTDQLWARAGRTAVMLLPLLVAYLWVHRRGL